MQSLQLDIPEWIHIAGLDYYITTMNFVPDSQSTHMVIVTLQIFQNLSLEAMLKWNVAQKLQLEFKKKIQEGDFE